MEMTGRRLQLHRAWTHLAGHVEPTHHVKATTQGCYTQPPTPSQSLRLASLYLAFGLPLGLGAPATAQVISPMPVPPEVVARVDQGRTTIRATRLTHEIRLDGQLDEQVYRTVPPITDFIQQLPPASVRLLVRTDPNCSVLIRTNLY